MKDTTFLGVCFDEKLSFANHIKNLDKRTVSRINLLKILSNKRWHLDANILTLIYKQLVRSIFDYSASILCGIRERTVAKLQVIQNSAMRAIFKLPRESPTETLLSVANAHGIEPILSRLADLGKRHAITALLNENPIIQLLVKEYKSGFHLRKITRATPLCATAGAISFFTDGTDSEDDQ